MSQWVHTGTRAVFFDAVGTLLFPDPPAAAVYAAAARRRGAAADEAEVRGRLWAAFRVEEQADRAAGWVTSEVREHARWRRIVAASLPGIANADDCFRELFDHFARPSAWRLAPGADNVIARLHARGLVLGLGTNYDARVRSVLDGHPALAPLRTRAVVSAAVGFRKPARDFFREVVRAAGCEPGEILFVGDDFENDYVGATAAGLEAVLLDPQGKRPDVPRRVRTLGEIA